MLVSQAAALPVTVLAPAQQFRSPLLGPLAWGPIHTTYLSQAWVGTEGAELPRTVFARPAFY